MDDAIDILFVGGNYREHVKGNNITYIGKEYKVSSNGSINLIADKGHSSRKPDDIPDRKAENEDFDISFALDKDSKTIVPLGILDFEGNFEKVHFQFRYRLLKADIDSLDFEIKDQDGNSVYQLTRLKPVIIKGKQKSLLFEEAKKNVSVMYGNQPKNTWDYKPLFASYDLQETDYTKIGDYILFWDGFDSNGIYDSTIFDNKRLSATITATKGNKSEKITVPFETQYSQVNWVDVKIDKNTKRIDVTLRVNLTDGGAKGLDAPTFVNEETTSGETFSSNELDPFKNIKKITISNSPPANIIKQIGQPIIKTRTKTFEELKKIVFSGLEHYWGRNKSRIVGNHVTISDSYEVFIHAKGSNNNALNALPLVYNTNGDWMRSGNPGGSYSDNNLDDDALDVLPDLGVIQRLSYNVGYIKHDWSNDKHNGWRHHADTDNGGYYDAISELKETAAHEIGHEILQAYGSTVYSWQHKGSSFYLPQDTKPIKGDETIFEKITHWDEMPETSGKYYPKAPNEIDLMEYYNSKDKKGNFVSGPDNNRLIAAEDNVLSLIWLTKIKIK